MFFICPVILTLAMIALDAKLRNLVTKLPLSIATNWVNINRIKNIDASLSLHGVVGGVSIIKIVLISTITKTKLNPTFFLLCKLIVSIVSIIVLIIISSYLIKSPGNKQHHYYLSSSFLVLQSINLLVLAMHPKKKNMRIQM